MKAKIGTLEDVAEGMRGEYEPNPDTAEGGFVLKLEGAETHPFNLGLVQKNKTLIKAESDAKKALEAYGGRDPARIKELEDAAAAAEDARLRAEGNWDAKEAAVRKHYEETVIPPLKADLALADTFLERTLVSDAIRSAAEEAGFHANLIVPFASPLVKKVKVDGGFAARVLAADGKTERIDGATGQPFTVLQLLKEMAAKEDYQPLLKPTGADGSGSGDGKGDKGVKVPFDPKKATQAQKSAFIREHGIAKWTALMEGASEA
jgi:hypothetical protein